MTRVLLICMGNICRSPMAEGILRRKLHERGLEGQLEVDFVFNWRLPRR
jgi:protein-tyrosine phosphatase